MAKSERQGKPFTWNYRLWREPSVGLTLRETYYNHAGQLYAASIAPEIGPAKSFDDILARIRNSGKSSDMRAMMTKDAEKSKNVVLKWPRKRWAKMMYDRKAKKGAPHGKV